SQYLSSSSYTLHLYFSFHSPHHPHPLHSFPTRRSSDLPHPGCAGLLHAQRFAAVADLGRNRLHGYCDHRADGAFREPHRDDRNRDRKSTRLNSSHVKISYAVFCLKKKKKKIQKINNKPK